MWRFMTDILLVCSFIYMGYRFFRSSATQVGELEASLQRLLREADASSKSLITELKERQGTLQKLLGELAGSQHELNRLIAKGDEQKARMEENLREIQAAQASTMKRSALAREVVRETVREEPEAPVAAPPPPSFQRAVRTEPVAPPPQVRIEKEEAPEGPRKLAVNIFGEPVVSEWTPEPAAESVVEEAPPALSLRSAIEREVTPQPEVVEATRDMQTVYEAAEEMIRAGNDLVLVASKTQLPMDDVRMLREMIAREEGEKQTRLPPPPADPRLGVLGKMKRQVETL